MDKVIKVIFEKEEYFKFGIRGLKQWNQGQHLEISGLDISDEIVEVHFSLQERDGTAKRMVGTVIDGVIHVGIPIFILEGPEWSSEYYNAYAWIYLSDEESAETVRKIEFTIEARPKPDEYVTPEELTFLQQLELAIQNKLDKSGHAPNKFLGTDEQGNVVTKEQEEFSLEVANEEKLGGVKPLNKTDDMTLEVGVAKDGRLFAKGKDITVDSKLDEESTNPVQNKVLTKEVKTLQERNTKLKETIEKLQIKQTTDKAPFHHITDSANMKVVDFGMEGKTEQETVAGNQLLNTYNITTKETNGITITQDNGRLILNGTSTDVIDLYVIGYGRNEDIAEALNAKLGTYRLSNNLGLENYFQRTNKTTSAQSIIQDTITIIEELQLTRAFVRIPSGKTYNNAILEIMLNSGDTALPFELYVGGTPSPNPDFPQEIVNAGVYNEETGRYEIGCSVVNKNWFNKEWIKDGSTYDVQEGSYWRKYFYLEPNTTYRCVVKKPLHVSDSLYISFLAPATSDFDKQAANGIVTILDGNAMDKQVRFTTPEDGKMIIKTNNNGLNIFTATFEEIIDDEATQIMIYKLEGAVDDTYVPYEGQPFTLTSPVPITKWDKLVKRDGVWGWSIFGLISSDFTFTLKGTDETYDGRVRHRYQTNLQSIYDDNISDIKCTHVIFNGYYTPDTNYTFTVMGSGMLYIYFFEETGIDTLEKANQWLANIRASGEVIEFVYNSPSEVAFHPLPDEEQTLLHNLETYYGVTNLYNDQGCPTWLTYVADPKLYLDNQLLEIKSAIV